MLKNMIKICFYPPRKIWTPEWRSLILLLVDRFGGLWQVCEAGFTVKKKALWVLSEHNIFTCVFSSYLDFPDAPKYIHASQAAVFHVSSEGIKGKCFHIFFLLVLMGQTSLKQEVTHHSYSALSSLHEIPSGPGGVTVLGMCNKGLTFGFA